MKEATGELNMTVITVVAIAAIAAFFYAFIWPAIQRSVISSQVCANGPSYQTGIAGQEGYVSCSNTASGNKYTCQYFQNGKSNSVTCTLKQ